MSAKHYTPEHSAPEFLEEAFALLLRGGVRAWVVYYVGALPFIMALLFFTAEMSTGAFAASHLLEGAALVSLAFGWMKLWQALFTRRLLACLTLQPPSPLTFRETLRLGIAQYAVHSTGLLLLPIAAIIFVPFGWVYAFYQSYTANADTSPIRVQIRRALRDCAAAPLANHTAIGVIFLGALILFINLLVVVATFPALLRMITGFEVLLNQNWSALFNTTLLLIVASATYLIIDPFVKAFYLLRSFRHQSLTSGRDLIVRLRRLRGVAATALLAILLGLNAPGAHATEPAREERLDRSIAEVLTRPEFAWRAPRQLAKENEQPSWLARMIRKAAHETEAFLKRWKDQIEAVIEWLFGKQDLQSQKPPPDLSAVKATLMKLLYFFCGVIVLLAAYMIWRSWKRRQRLVVVELAATPMVPDLTQDDVSADQLPADEWESLALELMAKGELRLATRALYLSGLAHLNSRDWITLAKAKSNREFRREITRRAPMHPDLVHLFGTNVLDFEKIWYGNHPATPESVGHSQATLHRLREF